MKQTWAVVAAGALLAVGAGGAWGQAPGLRIGRFDVGAYAGGSLTSDWFGSRTVSLNGTGAGQDNGGAQGFHPGFAPTFGAFAAVWLSPSLGVRANGGYTPMRLPYSGGGNHGGRVLNTWTYDLDLLLRPFALADAGDLWRSAYAFAGGGGLTVNVAGDNRRACQSTLLALGACLPLQPKLATVGQGTAGVGADLYHFGAAALFAELAAHVYDSPVHVGDGWVPPVTAPSGSTVRVADDKVAVTGRLVLGLRLTLGNLLPPPPGPPPPPPPQPAEPERVPPPVIPPPPPPVDGQMTVCVVKNGAISEVPIHYHPETGDTTTLDGRPLHDAYPVTDEYLVRLPWYQGNQPITVNGRRYVKYGLPRVLTEYDVTPAGSYRGVGVFAEKGTDLAHPSVVYLPYQQWCDFQPYQLEAKTGAVRG